MTRTYIVSLCVAGILAMAGLASAQGGPPPAAGGTAARVAQLEAQIAAILQRLGLVETKGTAHDTRLTSLDAAVAALAARVTALEAALASHAARLSAIEGTLFATTQTVAFERAVDLETGQVCASDELGACNAPPFDFTFVFNSARSNPTVVFQRGQATLALLTGVGFGAVSTSAGLTFTDSIIDVPFGPGDTAVIRTADGHTFKVGDAVCFTPFPDQYSGCEATETDIYVTFKYQQIP